MNTQPQTATEMVAKELMRHFDITVRGSPIEKWEIAQVVAKCIAADPEKQALETLCARLINILAGIDDCLGYPSSTNLDRAAELIAYSKEITPATLRDTIAELQKQNEHLEKEGAIFLRQADDAERKVAEQAKRIEELEQRNSEKQTLIDNKGYPSGVEYYEMREKCMSLENQLEALNASYVILEQRLAESRKERDEAEHKEGAVVNSDQYQPEIWAVKKDDIYSAMKSLRECCEYTEELLAKHERDLGRTTRSNRFIAEQMDLAIGNAQNAIAALSTPVDTSYLMYSRTDDSQMLDWLERELERDKARFQHMQLKSDMFDYLCWLEDFCMFRKTALDGKTGDYLVLASDGTTCWGKTYADAVRIAMEHDKEVFDSTTASDAAQKGEARG